mmetsp:Transcript_9288/g.28921  ORF Transcript_9288/g.28921 Transcript_9288/m.28921 type:complete len:101 (-) Transcript_9288:53-355(-)
MKSRRFRAKSTIGSRTNMPSRTSVSELEMGETTFGTGAFDGVDGRHIGNVGGAAPGATRLSATEDGELAPDTSFCFCHGSSSDIATTISLSPKARTDPRR